MNRRCRWRRWCAAALAGVVAIIASNRETTSTASTPSPKGALAALRPVQLATLALCATDDLGGEDGRSFYHCTGSRADYEASVDLTRDTVMLRALFMWHGTTAAFADSVFEVRRGHYRDRLGEGQRCAQYHYTWKVGDSVHVAVARTPASSADSSDDRVMELLDSRPLPAFLEC